MSVEVLGGSFRDPAGFVFMRDNVIYRQVNQRHAAVYDRFRDSGLYERLVSDGLLVAHEEEQLSLAVTAEAYRVLRPEPIPFISYPYEWSPGQRRAAALLTLQVQQLSLEYGMSLRDANAYNIQFRDGRPVLLDTLSFEPLREGDPWVAYQQFCRHFLAPLALETRVDARLGSLLRTNLDGLPLDLVATLLPSRTRLRPGVLIHVHLHARAGRRQSSVDEVRRRSGSFSLKAFQGLIESLRSAVKHLTWVPPTSTWSDYYATAEHYSDAAMANKEQVVADLAKLVAPKIVFDLGANTGRFSRVVAGVSGGRVIAFDRDVAAVEANWQQVHRDDNDRVLPLVMDLTNPSPGIGWANLERASLTERGPADLVMALALVHHLAIGNNVPLGRVASWLASLGQTLIIEFVPKEDAMVQRLLAAREDVFDDYDRGGFEESFNQHFVIDRREILRETGRSLYLMRARAAR